MNSVIDPQLQSDSRLRPVDKAGLAPGTVLDLQQPARAGVVNRTHRIVRERALVMQQKRSRDRSLMLPLIVCSVLLILTALAIWTGLYQYQATDPMQPDDANNQSLVVLLWFVPVFIAFLATLWVRRSRNHSDGETL